MLYEVHSYDFLVDCGPLMRQCSVVVFFCGSITAFEFVQAYHGVMLII